MGTQVTPLTLRRANRAIAAVVAVLGELPPMLRENFWENLRSTVAEKYCLDCMTAKSARRRCPCPVRARKRGR